MDPTPGCQDLSVTTYNDFGKVSATFTVRAGCSDFGGQILTPGVIIVLAAPISTSKPVNFLLNG